MYKQPTTPLLLAHNLANNIHKHLIQEVCEESSVLPLSTKLLLSYATRMFGPIFTYTKNKPWSQVRCPEPHLNTVKSQYNEIVGGMKCGAEE
jgi:hypothetical protein